MAKRPTLSAASTELTSKLRVERASRDGKKLVGGFFDPKVSEELKVLAARNHTTIQDLVGEALDDLLKKHGVAYRAT